MAIKKLKGLNVGRGLEAILGPRVSEHVLPVERADTENSSLRTLRVEQLQTGKYQPRTRMDEGSLYELAESIKAQGVMQPLLVRSIGPDQFEIIAGERRLRAAKLAGLTDVPVLVRDVPDETAAAMALIENIQREDLNPLEEAQGLRRLTVEFGLTHEQAAQAVGRSRSAASNLLRLLNLAEPVQQMLMAGDIDMGHARALLALGGAQQIISATEIASKKLSVREAEKLVVRASQQQAESRQSKTSAAVSDKTSRELRRIEQTLADLLTADVQVRVKKHALKGHEHGEVVIAFGSLSELHGLLEKLGLQFA